jgi:hypothetical protein
MVPADQPDISLHAGWHTDVEIRPRSHVRYQAIENNPAVHGQVIMWAHLLTERNLFDNDRRFVDFGSLAAFDLDVGVDDDAWLKSEDADRQGAMDRSAGEESQQNFIL